MKQEQHKQQSNTFLTIVALVILALAAGYLFAQGQKSGLRVTIEPAGITSPAPAGNPLVNNMARGNTAVNAYTPAIRAAEAKAVYDADPARVQACMDAAVARSGVPGCAGVIEALGTGR